MSQVKVYKAELYDEDYMAYTYDRVEVVLKSDYDLLKQEVDRLNLKYDFQTLVKTNDRLRAQIEKVVKLSHGLEREYLAAGGLVNPELMDPVSLGKALIEIAKLARQVAKEEGIEV